MTKDFLLTLAETDNVHIAELFKHYGIPDNFSLDDFVTFHRDYKNLISSNSDSYHNYCLLWSQAVKSAIEQMTTIEDLKQLLNKIGPYNNLLGVNLDRCQSVLRQSSLDDLSDLYCLMSQGNLYQIDHHIILTTASIMNQKAVELMTSKTSLADKLKAMGYFSQNFADYELVLSQIKPIITNLEEAQQAYRASLQCRARSWIGILEDVFIEYYWKKSKV